ncbi:MAG: hypothetical protein HY327_10160 [Chloroflexi bacterium]|nr:hypothetical protein [Chloroflexota bacterium]
MRFCRLPFARSAFYFLFCLAAARCTIPTPELLTPAAPPVITVLVVATNAPTLTPTATQTIAPTFTRAPTPTPRPRATVTRTQTVAAPAPIVWDARLDKLGIQLIPASVSPGELYWRLTKAEFWDEKERQGKHHIFVNVLDERGVRIIGQKVIVEWPDEKLVLVTEDKPAPEYSANYPLDINHYPPWGTLGTFTASVDGLQSDKVAGMGLPPMNIFVVYLLTFQRAIGR